MKSRKISVRLPLGLNDFIEKEVLNENTTISKWVVSALEKVQENAEVEKELAIVQNEKLEIESHSEPKEKEVEWSFFLMFIFIVAVLYGLFRKVINA